MEDHITISPTNLHQRSCFGGATDEDLHWFLNEIDDLPAAVVLIFYTGSYKLKNGGRPQFMDLSVKGPIFVDDTGKSTYPVAEPLGYILNLRRARLIL